MQVAKGSVAFEIRLPSGEHVQRCKTYLAAVHAARAMRQYSALEVWTVYSTGARYGVAVFPYMEHVLQCHQLLEDWELLHKERDDELLAVCGRSVEPQF